MSHSNRQGFTLVELLVVIAIIGLLSTIAVVSLSGARNKAVATKIVADLRTVQTALEIYATDGNGYPVAAPWSSLSLGTYMPVMPTPSLGTGYLYCNSGSYYLLMASTSNVGVIKPAGLFEMPFTGGGTALKCGTAQLYAAGGNLDCSAGTVYCLSNTSSPNAWQ